MNSQIFYKNHNEDEQSPKRKVLSKRPEVEDVLKYKDADQNRSNFSVKDPGHNRINASDLGQKKALSNCAEVYKVRISQSGVTF
jgi:hypothetical protein